MGDRPISIFSGGNSGYGHSIATGLDSYHFAIGWDCSAMGGAVPAPAPVLVYDAFYCASPVTAAFEWHQAGEPSIVFAAGNGSARASIIHMYATAGPTADNQAIGPYKDAVLYRHDGTTATNAAAFFCNGTGSAFARTTTTAGASSVPGDAKADVLAVVGSDLWRAEDFRVSKLTLSANPVTDSNWGTKIPVGIPTFPITRIVNLGGSPVACNGQGVWLYNDAPTVKEFTNILPIVAPHPDNGKNAFTDGRGRLYYDTADGHFIVVTYGYSSHQDPARTTTINRDTPWGRITTMTADLDHVYAATQPGQLRTQAVPGLKVFTYDATIYADKTSTVTGVPGALSLTSITTGDEILIGADEPFWGVYFVLADATATTKSVRTSLMGAELAAAFSTAGTNQFTTATMFDSTLAFARDGAMVFDVDNYAAGTWVRGTVNGELKYWMRITTGTALTGAIVTGVYVIPYRPPINRTVSDLTGKVLAQAVPHILVGSWEGEDIVWHDQWVLNGPQVDKLIVSRTKAASSTSFGYADISRGTKLFAISPPSKIWAMSVGSDQHPIRDAFPKLADYGESDVAMNEHILAATGYRHPQGHVWTCQGFVVDIPYIQEDDKLYLDYKWDEDGLWETMELEAQSSPVVGSALRGRGVTLHMVLSFVDGSRDAVAPVCRGITIPQDMWTDEGAETRHKQATQSPQVT